MKNVLKHYFENTLLFLCYLVNLITPKKKKQVFFYSMPDFSDSAREIYEEMKRLNLDSKYRVIWAVRDVEKYKKLLPDVVIVKHRSLKNLFYYCTSTYIFRTHSLWGNLYVRKRQRMFVAWHGMPLKNLLKGDPKPYKCDYINCTSDFFKKHLFSAVAIPNKSISSIGLARNDLLINENSIIKDLGYDKYNKIFLWMPTFRGSKYNNDVDGTESMVGLPIVSLSDLHKIDEVLASMNNLLILKLHPWSSKSIQSTEFSNIINISDSDIVYPHSLYELVGKVDILITDYSSVYIDFLLTDKPIWFVYDDIEEYRKTRGFAFEPAEKYMPGIKITNCEDLISCFNGNYDDSKYINERKQIKSIFHRYFDNRSAKRALSVIGIK